MLDREKAAEIFNRIQKHSSADEVEVLFYGGKNALTRFANNTIHQNVAEENYVVSVRTAFGGRTARATTNKLDDDSLKRVVQASESLAKVQQSGSRFACRCQPRVARAPAPASGRQHGISQQTAPSRRSSGPTTVKKIVSIAEKHRLTTAGIFSTSESVEGIFNSRGLGRLAHADFI